MAPRGDGAALLDPEVLARIRSMELLARTVVEGFVLGLHRSPFRGFSVEFAEYRPYVAGDDIKHIDWRVYARSDRHYLKLYEEETNLGCHLVLDASGSMGCGGPPLTKLAYGTRLAASLAYFMTRQRDAVGLTVFDAQVRSTMPARLRTSHLQRLLGELEQVTPGTTTTLAAPLHQAAEVIDRAGMIVLISDFLADLDGLAVALKHLRHVGHDLIAFQIVDRSGLTFRFSGACEFVDPERGATRRIAAGAAREAYLAAQDAHQQALGTILATAGVEHEIIATDQPLAQALAGYLYRRARRQG